MSVDYLICKYCGDTFCDCGSYVTCESCYNHWCNNDCAEEDGYIDEHCKLHKDLINRDDMEDYREDNCDFEDCCDCDNYEPASCKYCREEDFDDEGLLGFALRLLNMDRNEIIHLYKNDKKYE